MRRRKQIPRRRNLGLKSNVGRFAPPAEPRDRLRKMWTWVPNCRAAPQQSKGVWRPHCRDVKWKKKTPPNFSSGKAVLSCFPRTPPESPQSSGAPACAHFAIAIPGGRGGDSRKYGLAIRRIWEGFFFHLTYREGGGPGPNLRRHIPWIRERGETTDVRLET